ncbi:MAG: RluA family pseudouridine synthase, partial [Treponemataceae bacterium]
QDDSNRRLDRVLRKFLKKMPLSLIYKSLRCGNIKINGAKKRPEYLTQENDCLQINESLLNISAEKPEKKEFSKDLFAKWIVPVFENEHLLIINKPYDIPVHVSKSTDFSLDDIIKNHYQEKNDSLSFSLGPLHRLDRQTTGLLAFSKSLAGAQWFSSAIKNHQITKTYLALLWGHLENAAYWEDSISKKNTSDGFFTMQHDEKGSLAKTQIEPLQRGTVQGKKITLAKIKILTGKMHQIRFQCSAHGFPLVGDSAYQGSQLNDERLTQKLFLHAAQMQLPKNDLNLPKKIECLLPRDFEILINKIAIFSFL